MTSQDPQPSPIAQAADLVADELDADVVHFVGLIERPADSGDEMCA